MKDCRVDDCLPLTNLVSKDIAYNKFETEGSCSSFIAQRLRQRMHLLRRTVITAIVQVECVSILVPTLVCSTDKEYEMHWRELSLKR